MIGDILYNIFIMPIELIVELIFRVMYDIFGAPGIAIIGVSIVVNLLVLPLYKKSDAMQEKEREKQKQMEPWLRHIRHTFKGDERYMMQSAYYRQQGYKPVYAVKGSFSLLLQIPFFMAAYHFLSHLVLLHGASFLFLKDLGSPDALIRVGSLKLNLLPILMTAINMISGAIYTRGFPLKDKLQLYAMALVFLVLLYDSPSGLVFYWTLNNLFSLGKNVVMKLVKPRHRAKRPDPVPVDRRVFILGAVFLTVLTGAVIPMAVISSSPTEFMLDTESPLLIVLNSVTVTGGFFILWLSIFYYLSGVRMRNIFSYSLWLLIGIGLTDFLFFTNNYGFISSYLKYDETPMPGMPLRFMNLGVLIAVCLVFAFVLKKWSRAVRAVLIVLIVAGAGTCVYQGIGVTREVNEARELMTPVETEQIKPVIPMSKKGRNVIVLMLDRAISCYLPDIMKEKPEIAAALEGFTYYPNALAFSHNTNTSTPALFGGYEYTPDKINARTGESLKTKQNEALSVLPRIFGGDGFTVTAADLPYAGNYEWVPDMSYFNRFENVTGIALERKYTKSYFEMFSDYYQDVQKRNFVYYSVFRCAPLLAGGRIYDNGNYLTTTAGINMNWAFFNSYSVMQILSELTDIREEGDTFLTMQNSITHEPVYLSVPDYEPNPYITKGIELTREPHYMVNMAAFMKLADWFEFMREQGVWDNTRIIIVSDHGRNLGDLGSSGIPGLDIEYYNPILMMKDFGAKEFTTDDTFMTIGDVASMAVEGVIEDPVNPYSGKPISNEAKYTEDMYVTTTGNWDVQNHHGEKFDTEDGRWYVVRDNVFDPNCWQEVPDPNAE